MPESVHTARWIRQLNGQGWDIHLFPATGHPPHASLTDITLHRFSRVRPRGSNPGLRVSGYPLPREGYLLQQAAKRIFPQSMSDPARLASVIRRIKPDIVHSLGVQHGGYLTLEAKQIYGAAFPPWLVSSWGNDVYLCGRLVEHAAQVDAVLGACDAFTADCERDLLLARSRHGFTGRTFPALPGAGGLDIELAKSLRPPGPTSARREIALKGYQNWYGRALDGLRAIEMCADVLQDYTVVVYFSNPDVAVAAELMSQKTGVKVRLVPAGTYEDSLRLHARARVSVAVSLSDGLPLSTIEAAMMGSFPVQTNTSCVGDRLTDGVGTLLVPVEDIGAIAAAVRRALTDDELVDHAAEVNFRYISEHLSTQAIRPKVIDMYQKMAEEPRA